MSALQLTQRGRGRGRRNAGFRSPGALAGHTMAVTGTSEVYTGNVGMCVAATPATSTVGFAEQTQCADPARARTSCSGGSTASAVHDSRQQNNATGAPADVPKSRARPWNSAQNSRCDSPRGVHMSLPSARYPGHIVDRSWEDGQRASQSQRAAQSQPRDCPDPTRARTSCTGGSTAPAVHHSWQPKNTIRDVPQSRAKPRNSALNGHAAVPLSSAHPPGHMANCSWKDGRQASQSRHREGQRRMPLAEALNVTFNKRASFESRQPSGLGCAPSTKPSTQLSRSKHPKAFNDEEPLRGRVGASSVGTGVGQLYALHLHENCPGLPPVADIVKRLQEIQAEFQRDNLSMERQCSMTDSEHCWVLDNLRTLNRILVRVDLELKEEEPQKLCICSLDKAVVAHSNSDWVFDACILFHLLLKRHRCIQTLNLDRTVIASGYPQLLCDALACNRSLRHLAITCWDFSPAMARPLVYSLCKMPALETVSISRLVLKPNVAGRIGNMLGRAKSLRSVQLLNNDMSLEAGKELMKGLSRNGNLEVIKFGDSALGPEGACSLGELLANSCNLRELALQNLPGFDEQQAVSIVDGLKRNRSLCKLELHGCSVPFGGIDALAEVLKNNTTLKCLVLSACCIALSKLKSVSIMLEFNKDLLELDLRDNLIDDVAAIRLAQALRFNQHLQKLNLEANRINSQGAVALVDALRVNTVLKELTLGCVEPEDDDDEDVTNALDRAVAYDRVRLCYDMRGVFQLSANLRINANRITSVHLDSSVELEAACLKDLFIALATVPCLEDLCIESPATMDGTAARRLYKVLTTTKTLKLLQISGCNMDSVALTTVMNAMQRNQTVVQLDMEYSTSDMTCTNAFIDMIKSNRTLTHFGYMSTKLSELQVIARELQANYTLTTFKIWEGLGFGETVFEINEILRRNASYLNRTVEFALYPQRFGTEWAPAAAFEDACGLKSFRNHLVKLTGSRAAARKAVLNARRYITTNLFAITGVCQGPVRCRPHPKGARQIDCLNEPCLLSIFAYLKATDIIT